jgi:dihydrofolate reductase
MTQVALDITMSLDGYVAGPSPSHADPLGENGMLLHEWVFGLRTWRAQHGLEGGETNAVDDALAERLAAVGAQVMGRKMFSGGSGPWKDDANAAGWWGDEPPFRCPVYVVTHHERESVHFENGSSFVFVDGFEEAVSLAREAAGEQDVRIAGGASVANQCLQAGLVDRIDLHVAPVILGGGTRLFDGVSFTQLGGAAAHFTVRPTAR